MSPPRWARPPARTPRWWCSATSSAAACPPFDRILATRFGAAAVRLLAEGRYGQVVVSRGAKITTVAMSETAGKIRTVPKNYEMIQTARALGIAFGDEEELDLTPQPLE